MTVIIIFGQRHEAHNCPDCGVVYTCPEHMIDSQRKSGLGAHFCCNGHRLSYTTSENDKLRRERDLLKQDQARLEDELRLERAKAVRLAKRTKAGVCPCCTRTFSNMARHMKSKHPDYNVVPLKAAKA